MGIEVIAWVLSLTAIVFLLVLLGRLFVTVLKIAIVVALIWFVMSKIYPTKEITPPTVKIKRTLMRNLAALVFSLTLTLSSAEVAMESRAKVQGTFIQYQTWMMAIDAKRWEEELDAMKKAGITTLFLQWLRYDHDRFYPINAPGNDPTELVLSYADRNKMKVWVGLDFDSTWWQSWEDADYLKRTAGTHVEFAAKVSERYSKHASMAGWYVPEELSDYDLDDDTIKNLRTFYRTIADGCRKLKGRLPVAASVFFTRRIPAETVKTVFEKLIPGSGIDLLLIQDGVGTQNWGDKIADNVPAYFRAFHAAAGKAGITAWGILENFTSTRDSNNAVTGRVPSDVSQLVAQIRHESPLVEKLVLFDFFHYMGPTRGPLQKQLYNSYLTKTAP